MGNEVGLIEEVPDERVEDFTWLTITDVRDILESTSGPKDHIRNRFLLSLLYESGARIDEILSLKLQDFKPEFVIKLKKESPVVLHFCGTSGDSFFSFVCASFLSEEVPL